MSENKDSSNEQQKANAEDSKRKKKKKEDFYFGKLLGEGSYSTVGTYLFSLVFINFSGQLVLLVFKTYRYFML